VPRLPLRTTIRELLEDLAATGSPLWSDAALTDYLVVAMRTHGARFPRQATAATAPTATTAISVALPARLLARGALGRSVGT